MKKIIHNVTLTLLLTSYNTIISITPWTLLSIEFIKLSYLMQQLCRVWCLPSSGENFTTLPHFSLHTYTNSKYLGNPNSLRSRKIIWYAITLSIYTINQDNYRQLQKKSSAIYTSNKNPHFFASPNFSIAKPQFKILYHTSPLYDSANLTPYKAH